MIAKESLTVNDNSLTLADKICEKIVKTRHKLIYRIMWSLLNRGDLNGKAETLFLAHFSKILNQSFIYKTKMDKPSSMNGLANSF